MNQRQIFERTPSVHYCLPHDAHTCKVWLNCLLEGRFDLIFVLCSCFVGVCWSVGLFVFAFKNKYRKTGSYMSLCVYTFYPSVKEIMI